MSSIENTLARMKGLYTYGKNVNEGTKKNAYSLEHSAVAADGKTYGIIRECNKFYIKVAQNGKETIAEAYSHLGGYCNKKNYEYTSFNNALKNFELKMASINEANNGVVNISTLDPFKKEEYIVEGTEAMKNQIARQRQIMYNVGALLNEETGIGASRKNDVVMNRDANPEAETGKRGDEELTKTDAKPEYTGSKTNGVDKKVGPFDNDPAKCPDQLKEECDCGEGSCDCDWGSEGIGKGKDPKQVGWEMEGQTIVNEEEDWGSEGLPSTPGVGEADTDHNNDPFTKTVNEEEDVEETDVESDDVELDDLDGEEYDVEDFDTDIDTETEDDIETGVEPEDFDSSEDEDILSKIAELQAQIDALKAQVGDETVSDDMDVDMEKDIDSDVDTTDLDTELDGEEMVDDEMNEDYFDDEVYFGDEEDDDVLNRFLNDPKNQINPEDEMEMPDEMSVYDDEMDECGVMDNLMEAKKAYTNRIVESVVNKILNEDELHVWGKHPGYQKKPMELPTTGEDKNQWGEDWNDESIRSEQPFGTQIGDSAPYDKLVDAIANDVMAQLSGDAFKKKVK